MLLSSFGVPPLPTPVLLPCSYLRIAEFEHFLALSNLLSPIPSCDKTGVSGSYYDGMILLPHGCLHDTYIRTC